MTPPHGVCHSLHCLSEALTGLEKSFADLAQRLDPIRRQEPVKVDSEKIGHSSGVPLVDEIDQLASRITSLDVRLEQLIGSIDL